MNFRLLLLPLLADFCLAMQPIATQSITTPDQLKTIADRLIQDVVQLQKVQDQQLAARPKEGQDISEAEQIRDKIKLLTSEGLQLESLVLIQENEWAVDGPLAWYFFLVLGPFAHFDVCLEALQSEDEKAALRIGSDIARKGYDRDVHRPAIGQLNHAPPELFLLLMLLGLDEEVKYISLAYTWFLVDQAKESSRFATLLKSLSAYDVKVSSISEVAKKVQDVNKIYRDLTTPLSWIRERQTGVAAPPRYFLYVAFAKLLATLGNLGVTVGTEFSGLFSFFKFCLTLAAHTTGVSNIPGLIYGLRRLFGTKDTYDEVERQISLMEGLFKLHMFLLFFSRIRSGEGFGFADIGVAGWAAGTAVTALSTVASGGVRLVRYALTSPEQRAPLFTQGDVNQTILITLLITLVTVLTSFM